MAIAHSACSEPRAGLRDAVVALALAAGAGAARVTTAAPDPETAERFAAAVARGDLATWPYDAAYARRAADPQAILPGARSVVCLAVGYAAPAGPAVPRSGTGRVSRYALGEDYHRRVRAIAQTVARGIEGLAAAGEIRTVVACDTAPLAERAFAARAGLGWIGKHTNLIAPGLGSYVFLAEIVTTLELAPHAPLAKRCGSCTRCLPACPTGALRGDGTMDASRCISDLTQRTDVVPPALRPLMGTWVWGCDQCQAVCPPTRQAGDQAAPAAGESEPDLQALLALRSGTFRRRYRGTAMGWRGAAVLRRNAALALGNGLDRADVPALAAACARDPHPLVRAHAAWALGRIGSPRAYATLAECARHERDARVHLEIAAARSSAGNTAPPAPVNEPEETPLP